MTMQRGVGRWGAKKLQHLFAEVVSLAGVDRGRMQVLATILQLSTNPIDLISAKLTVLEMHCVCYYSSKNDRGGECLSFWGDKRKEGAFNGSAPSLPSLKRVG
jgi:hypothetical protein